MKNLKRVLCGLLCLVLLAGMLSGCDQKGKESSDPSSQLKDSAEKRPGAYQVGLLQYMEHPAYDTVREAFMSRLEEWDWNEDLLNIEYQNAGGDENKAKEICGKFVTDQVDMIVAISAPAAKAAAEAVKGTEIKVLFANVEDPAEELGGLSGNVTGVQTESTVAAVVDLALRADPNLKTFGVIYNPQENDSAAQADKLKRYCVGKDIAVEEALLSPGAAQEEMTKAVTDLCGKAGAVFLPIDSKLSSLTYTLSKAALDAKRPCYAGTDSAVQSGALAAVSLDYTEIGRQTADMAVEIAAGKAVSEVPMVKANAGKICFNQNTLDDLKTVFPDEILETADFYTTNPAAEQ